MFYFLFGWLMGRNIRATRQAAYNAALPESVKEERYAQQQAQAKALAAAETRWSRPASRGASTATGHGSLGRSAGSFLLGTDRT